MWNGKPAPGGISLFARVGADQPSPKPAAGQKHRCRDSVVGAAATVLGHRPAELRKRHQQHPIQ